MALTGQNLQDAFALYKTNIDDVTAIDGLMLQWMNASQRMIYNKVAGTDPERFLALKSYTVSELATTAALPSDFMSLQPKGCGLFKHKQNKLGYDAQTGAFTAALTITGATSGATGVISADDDNGTTGVLTLTTVSGTFQDGEIITDTSTGSATVDLYQSITDDQLGPARPGQSTKGFYIKGTDLVFTGIQSSTVYTMRYLPKMTALTSNYLSETLILPDEYLELGVLALDVQYTRWDEDSEAESLADQRFVRALDEMLDNLRKEPDAYEIFDVTSYFV